MAEIKKVIEIPNENNDNHPTFKATSCRMASGNGHLYLQGGSLRRVKNSDDFIQNLWEFDLSNLIWKPIGNLEAKQLGRENHAIVFDDDHLFLIGGRHKEETDGIEGIDKINLNTFEVTHIDTPALNRRTNHTAVVRNNKIYIIGGTVPNGSMRPPPTDDFYIFDTKTNEIQQSKLPFGAISLHTSFIDDNGIIYVIGGKVDNSNYSKQIHMYDIYKAKWESIDNPFDAKLWNLQSVFVESKGVAVIAGGRIGPAKSNDQIYIFDTKNKELRKNETDIKILMPDCGMTMLNDILYIFGSVDKNITAMSFDSSFSLNSLIKSSGSVIVDGVSCVAVELGEKPKLDENVKKTLQMCECNYDDISAILLENGYNTDEMFQLLDSATCKEIGIDPVVSGKIFSKRADVYDEDDKFGEGALKNFTYLTECETGTKLGNGAFGVVCKGMWLGTTPVAMKAIDGALDDPAKLQEIIKEAYVTQMMKHPNVITMYGLYRDTQSLYMVIDLAEGCLLDFVQNKNGKYPQSKKMTFKDMLRCCMDVASGMAYLESQKIVHRDLALRNVLYIHDRFGIRGKVADLGLSRKSTTGEYIAKTTANTMPFRWTAPEAAASGIFNVKSDIWAYGITIWELFTKGMLPYSHLNPKDVIPAVNAGTRLAKPDLLKHPFPQAKKEEVEEEPEDDGYGDGGAEEEPASDEKEDEIGNEIWAMMQRTWDVEPGKRPSFKEMYKIEEKLYNKIPDEKQEEEPEEEEAEEDNGYE